MSSFVIPDVVDLFAGPGGWSLAVAALGMVEVGVENDPSTVATRTAAGFRTMAESITTISPTEFQGVKGVIASPPCPTFSKLGNGSGRRELDLILRCIEVMDAGSWPADLIAQSEDPRTMLTLQPLRWVLVTEPTWFAFEQVPAVLPVWEAMCEVLERRGYSTASGHVQAEQHGVPQARKRAVAVGRRDGKTARLPVPTHSRYHPKSPDRLDRGVERWVSMAEALDLAHVTLASPLHTRAYDRSIPRTEAQPAPTMTFGHNAAAVRWVPRFNDQSGTKFDHDWPEKRPATVVAGRDIVQNPGATANRFNGSTKSRNDGVRVTVEEAAILQSFPATHPFQGTKSKQYQQVGNAVPPLMALAILAEITR